MEQSGYSSVKVSNIVIPVSGTRTIFSSSLPTAFRLYGFSVWVQSLLAGVYFRLYDGDSTTDPLWSIRSQSRVTGWNNFDLMLQDDSYIRIDDGLYIEIEYSGVFTKNIAMNVFY